MTPQRQKFPTRTINILDDQRRQLAVAALLNAPSGIEVVLREPVKVRKDTQNALMWSGTLADIARQAWVDGRQYSDEIWHEHCKRQYLPEEDDPDLHELVKDPCGYRKWDYTPSCDRVCVGSTTELTVKGFSVYLDQVYAFGASLGVLFSARN